MRLYRQTDRLEVFQRQVQTQRRNTKVTNRVVIGWMESLSEECGNGCERRQINMTNERRMEFNDRMQWHTNTLTYKQKPSLHAQVNQNCNYPIILPEMIVSQKTLLTFCDK